MMRKVVLIILGVGLSYLGYTQQDTVSIENKVDETELTLEERTAKLTTKPEGVVTDVILFHDETRYYVDIKRIYKNDLYYSFPGETKVHKIDNRLINKVIYKSGEEKVLHEKPEETKELKDWRKIVVTHKKRDVAGYRELEHLEARVEGKNGANTTAKSLEKSASIILRQKAAIYGADIILITSKKSEVSFGQAPTATFKAIAYSYK